MGFVANVLRGTASERRAQVSGAAEPASWLTELVGGELSASGKRVTPGSAMTLSAVYAAVRLLSFSVAVLPLPLFRRSGKAKERITSHPVYRLLNQRPNAWQTAFEFRAMMQGHLCLRGNAYAEIRTTQAGSITSLVPLHPDRVTVLLTRDELPVYEYRPRSGGPPRKLAREDVMHLKGLSLDGYTGISVISAAREGLGLAMAAEEHASRFYSNDASPGGVLTHPGVLSKEGKQRLKDGWAARHQGAGNAHRTALLEEGVKYEVTGISQKDQQFLELRQFQLGEVARWFNVPPHMIGELSRSTNNNIEAQGLDFVRYSLQPWLETWEQAMHRDLLGPVEQQSLYVEHTTAALLRGELKTRSEAYAIARQNGWLSADDVRALENMNPLPDGQGEVYLVPSNMIPADKVGELGGQSTGSGSPPTTAGDSSPQPTRPKGSRSSSLASAFVPALRDVGARCERREAGEVQKAERRLPPHATETGERTWWQDAVYREHQEYVARSLTPIIASCALALCTDQDAEDVLEEAGAFVARAAERAARAGIRRRLGEDPEPGDWAENEARRLEAHFAAWRDRQPAVALNPTLELQEA